MTRVSLFNSTLAIHLTILALITGPVILPTIEDDYSLNTRQDQSKDLTDTIKKLIHLSEHALPKHAQDLCHKIRELRSHLSTMNESFTSNDTGPAPHQTHSAHDFAPIDPTQKLTKDLKIFIGNNKKFLNVFEYRIVDLEQSSLGGKATNMDEEKVYTWNEMVR